MVVPSLGLFGIVMPIYQLKEGRSRDRKRVWMKTQLEPSFQSLQHLKQWISCMLLEVLHLLQETAHFPQKKKKR